MRGLGKRLAEREAQKAREVEEWQAALTRFRLGLDSAGVQLSPLFVEVEATSPVSDARWFTWWLRRDVDANAAKVQTAVAANYITDLTLHSHVAAPGESVTAQMWLDAEVAGKDALGAALMLTAIRATERRPDVLQAFPVQKYRDQLFRWSWDALAAASIDPYTRSSRWFLPLLLETDRNARDKGELIDLIAANLATFLLEWTPVQVRVRNALAEALTVAAR
jgi:hypothetical protein